MKLGQNATLAEKSIEAQSQFLKNQPSEQRKTFTRIGYVVGGIIIIFFLFIGFLVYTGNKDFADTFLKFCSYLATGAFSYFIGRKSGKDNKEKNGNEEVTDIEEID